MLTSDYPVKKTITKENDSVDVFCESLVSNTPEEEQLFSTIFNENYKNEPEIPILIDLKNTSKFTTRSELKTKALKCAANFKRIGLKKGDVVAICSPGNLEYPILFYASLATGCIFAPMRHSDLSSAVEIENDMDTIEPKLLVLDHSEKDAFESAKKKGIPNIVMFTPDTVSDIPEGIQTFNDAFLLGEELEKPYYYTKEEKETLACCLYFTSGSTGRRKAVMINQSSLLWFLQGSPSLRFATNYFMVSSFSFVSTLPGWLLYPLNRNYTTYIIHKTIGSIDSVCEAVQKFKIDNIFLPPYLAYSFAKQPELSQKYDLSSIKKGTSGGTMVDHSTLRKIKKNTGIVFINVYAMTECFSMFIPSSEAALDGSVGYAQSDFSIRIVDSEENEVDVGKMGELRVKGPTITRGYYRNPKATAELYDDQGYVKTGDIFRRDEKGFYYYVTRLKDLIKYRSNHIYPIEIEKILLTHPNVSDCAVVGIYMKKEGTEYPRAFVTLVGQYDDKQQLLKEIQEHADSQLFPNKRLRGGVVELDAFPRTGSGKIQRFELRQWANKN